MSKIAREQRHGAIIDRARPERALLVLAHGAGAGMDTPFMEATAHALAADGLSVARFEFPYMERRRREQKILPPDRMPILEARFLALTAALRAKVPLFVGGKSMGARVAAQIAERAQARAVIALGYPFHPPRKPAQLRVDALRTLTLPCLVVQGTRDALGSAEEVPGYALPGHVAVHWLEDGDHSFVPRKASGRTLAQNMDDAARAVGAFVREHA